MVEILEMTKPEQKPALLDELLILPPIFKLVVFNYKKLHLK